MDPKLLRVFQRTLADQCRCWGLIVFDGAGVPVACAALCLFSTEWIETANPFIVRCRESLRRWWPGFGRMKVLFCGLPVPCGSTHLRVRPNATMKKIVAELERVMRHLAHSTGSRLMIFKELDDASGALGCELSALGYIRGDIPPSHQLDASYASFATYRDALKSRYRAQIQRSQNKLAAAGFETLRGRGGAFFATHFNAQVHGLYVALQQRAAYKLELLPLPFFLDLATELGDEALLTLIRREGRICAFTFAVTRAGTHYNLYSGLDYTANNEGDLYFNLFYADMDAAFCSGATSLHLGQTSDRFKSRLGTSARPLWFFARARSRLLHALLRLFAPLAFPKVEAIESHDVFAAS